MPHRFQVHYLIFAQLDVDCGSPEETAHGIVSLPANTTYLASYAQYTCEPNYKLEGFERRMCLENGSWSGAPPTCKGTLSIPNRSWLHLYVLEENNAETCLNRNHMCRSSSSRWIGRFSQRGFFNCGQCGRVQLSRRSTACRLLYS